jgi:hypothetical protein
LLGLFPHLATIDIQADERGAVSGGWAEPARKTRPLYFAVAGAVTTSENGE